MTEQIKTVPYSDNAAQSTPYFDNTLAEGICKKLGLKIEDVDSEKFYQMVVAECIDRAGSLMEIMEVSARNFMVPVIIDKIGITKIESIVKDDDKAKKIVNYLYGLGAHQNRSESIDKTIETIWGIKKKNKTDLDFLEDEKDKADNLLSKLIECVQYNSSSRSFKVLHEFLGDLRRIKIDYSQASMWGFIGFGRSRDDLEELDKYRDKLYKAISEAVRDVTNSYEKESAIDEDLWIHKGDSIRHVYDELKNIKSENILTDIEANTESGIRSIGKIYVKLLCQINPSELEHHKADIQDFFTEYLAMSENGDRKENFLDYLVSQIKAEKIPLNNVIYCVRKFFKSNQHLSVITHALGVLQFGIKSFADTESLKSDDTIQANIRNSFREALNAKELDEGKTIERELLRCMDETKDRVKPHTVIDFIKQLFDRVFDKDQYDEDIAGLAFNVFESVVNSTGNSSYISKDVALRNNVNDALMLIFKKNNDPGLLKKAVNLLAVISPPDDLLNLIVQSSNILNDSSVAEIEGVLSLHPDLKAKSFVSLMNYYEYSKTLAIKNYILQQLSEFLDKHSLYEKVTNETNATGSVQRIIRRIGRQKLYLATEEQTRLKDLILENLDKYKEYDRDDYYNALEDIVLRN